MKKKADCAPCPAEFPQGKTWKLPSPLFQISPTKIIKMLGWRTELMVLRGNGSIITLLLLFFSSLSSAHKFNELTGLLISEFQADRHTTSKCFGVVFLYALRGNCIQTLE